MNFARPPIIGLSTGPENPYSLRMEGKAIANIKSGVYFGWASLRLPSSHSNQPPTTSSSTTTTAATGFSVYPMVMSIGYNDFYDNTTPSVEVHLLHSFEAGFYGVEMRLLITGFIGEMRDYAGVNELIEDIKVDCDVARNSLNREAWALRETGKGTLDGSWLVRKTAEAE
ncbi:unnamed protein product [Rhizoctonia solani]|uniref:Riboflavin kinase n=1 Tax=Rhizoctonia solani TaxID=456999 RepID=A0A8H2WRL9_9AGAM|nr:unnamed protein product [Rhizoctonia solani]